MCVAMGKHTQEKLKLLGLRGGEGKKERKRSMSIKVREKGRGKGDPVAGAETLLQPMERITVEQVGSS